MADNTLKPGHFVHLTTGAAPIMVLGVRGGKNHDMVRVVRIPERIHVNYPPEMAMLETSRLRRYRSIDAVPEMYRCRLHSRNLADLMKFATDWANIEIDFTSDKQETPMPTLYQTKDEPPRFGTLLATNSAGRLVVEMKGTGEVLTFDKTEIEVVHPYTVSVRFADKTHHYLAEKGEVAVGDLLLLNLNNALAHVVALNTKSSLAKERLRGVKLITAPIGGNAPADVVDADDL